jgi:hypothetical protein
VQEDEAHEDRGARRAEVAQLRAQRVHVAAQRVLHRVPERIDGHHTDREEAEDGDDPDHHAHGPRTYAAKRRLM